MVVSFQLTRSGCLPRVVFGEDEGLGHLAAGEDFREIKNPGQIYLNQSSQGNASAFFVNTLVSTQY